MTKSDPVPFLPEILTLTEKVLELENVAASLYVLIMALVGNNECRIAAEPG